MFRGKIIVNLTIVLATITLAACKNTSNSTNAPVCTITASGACVVIPGFSGGSSVVLNVVNNNVLSSYAGTLVNPTSPVMINIVTHPVDNNFLGEVNIQYYTGSTNHAGHMTNGTSTDHGNNVNTLTIDSTTGLPTYRLFFEDPAGVIIVTMTGTGGDANLGTLNGSVYFRNFNSPAPNPLYQDYQDPYTGTYFQHKDYNFCWSGMITQGPYDCRNMTVPPSLTGSYAVTLLGTFTGLDKKAALGL